MILVPLWNLGFWLSSAVGVWGTTWWLDNAGTPDEPSEWVPVLVVGLLMVAIVLIIVVVVGWPILLPFLLLLSRDAAKAILAIPILGLTLLRDLFVPILRLLGVSQ